MSLPRLSVRSQNAADPGTNPKSLGKLELTQTFSPQPERCRSRNKSLRVQGESRSCAVKREERVLTTPTTLDLTPRIRAASPPSRHPASLSTLSTPFTLRPAVSLLCAAPSPAHRSLEGTELSRRTSRTDRRVHGVQHRHDPRVRLSIHCHHPTSSTQVCNTGRHTLPRSPHITTLMGDASEVRPIRTAIADCTYMSDSFATPPDDHATNACVQCGRRCASPHAITCGGMEVLSCLSHFNPLSVSGRSEARSQHPCL